MPMTRRLWSGTAPAPTKPPCAFPIRIPASCGPTSTCNYWATLRRRRVRLNPQQTYDPKSVMHYFAPAQVPVLSELAQKFAVCDHWFASAPCQTWPNRWFVHAATADGQEKKDPPPFPDTPTIFNRLEQAGIDNWKIYFHDFAQAHTLLQLFLLGDHFQSYRQFQADCQT